MQSLFSGVTNQLWIEMGEDTAGCVKQLSGERERAHLLTV